MSSNAIPAQGMKFQIEMGSGTPTYQDIPEVKTFSGPGGSAAVIDTTDLNSTAKEKRMGLADEGQLQLGINFRPDNAVHKELRAAKADRVKRKFKIIFTDTGGTEWAFDGFVTSVPVSGGVDGVVEGQVAIEITGAITETA